MEMKNRSSQRNHALKNEMHELSRERSEVASYIAMQLGDRLSAMELYIKELINLLGAVEGEAEQRGNKELKRILETIPGEFIKWDLVNLVDEAKGDALRLGEYADASVRSMLKRSELH